MAGIFAEEPLEIFQCDKPTGKTSQAKFLHPNLGTMDAKMPRKERMKTLATIMTSRENGRLSRTIVNRLWAKFFGRGLVQTLDDMEQPSWHPDLLDWLATDLADHAYDLKHTMSLLLTSQTYQLPSLPSPERMETAEVFRGPLTRRMTAEQFVDALGSFTGRRFQTPANDKIDLSAGLPTDRIHFLREKTRKARWISAQTNDGEKTETAFFRKRFQTDSQIADAYIAAADSFHLFVNGKLAGKGKGRTKVFRFDLQNYLTAGSNLIALKATRSEEQTKPSAVFALIRLAQGQAWRREIPISRIQQHLDLPYRIFARLGKGKLGNRRMGSSGRTGRRSQRPGKYRAAVARQNQRRRSTRRNPRFFGDLGCFDSRSRAAEPRASSDRSRFHCNDAPSS